MIPIFGVFYILFALQAKKKKLAQWKQKFSKSTAKLQKESAGHDQRFCDSQTVVLETQRLVEKVREALARHRNLHELRTSQHDEESSDSEGGATGHDLQTVATSASSKCRTDVDAVLGGSDNAFSPASSPRGRVPRLKELMLEQFALRFGKVLQRLPCAEKAHLNIGRTNKRLHSSTAAALYTSGKREIVNTLLAIDKLRTACDRHRRERRILISQTQIEYCELLLSAAATIELHSAINSELRSIAQRCRQRYLLLRTECGTDPKLNDYLLLKQERRRLAAWQSKQL
ncbi:MAG: hypothetical protein MHM6MM_004591 [Cercozoa sp. M6MM]